MRKWIRRAGILMLALKLWDKIQDDRKKSRR